MMNSNVLPTHNAHIQSFKRFYERCQKTGTLAMPIFSQTTQTQLLSIVGQYISEGMAAAMSEVFCRNSNLADQLSNSGDPNDARDEAAE